VNPTSGGHMTKRIIGVVTGTRAEYGLLYWLMKEIQDDPELELQLIVTGMHLSPEYGLTYKLIEEDGFTIDAKVEMLLSSDTSVGIAKSIGLGVIGFAEILDRLKPDILVLLGDRYEVLAAAQAAMVSRIPIAHLHGGESTEGLIDEAIRHAITKMAHLHFVASESYRSRVIQLGEENQKIYNFGALGIDNIKKLKLLNKKDFEDSIDFKLGIKNFLVTYHPVTLQHQGPEEALSALFSALDQFPDAHIIFTKPNSDMDGRKIAYMIDEYAEKQPNRVMVSTSLGQLRYLSAINHVDIVIGNSSSGIIEVPFFKKPTINLGSRQRGRLKAATIVDCEETEEAIIKAIHHVLSSEFQNSLKNAVSLFGDGNTSHQIKRVLKYVNLDGILLKKFQDLKVEI
jgi:UDP-hydrolysing UDP-N-acetyl-D-glucosamine 2-epimerase